MEKKYAGYTLVEMLIVLLLVSVFVGLPVTVLPRFQENLRIHQFFNQFEKNLLLTQQSALFSDQFTELSREAGGERCLVFDLDKGERLLLPIPKELLVHEFRNIRFNKDTGSTGYLGAVRFTWQSGKQKVSYIFLFGQGHYEKEVIAIT